MFLRDNIPNIVFRVPEGLLFGCMKFGWVVGFQSFQFAMGWVGLGRVSGLVGWVGWINWTHGQLCSYVYYRDPFYWSRTQPVGWATVTSRGLIPPWSGIQDGRQIR